MGMKISTGGLPVRWFGRLRIRTILSLPLSMAFLMMAGTAQAIQAIDQPILHPAIPLLDEAGNHVLDSGNPYSSKMTCGTGGCHDYESITHAFHIEQGRDETSDDYGELRGLSILTGPGYYGGYNCMGGSNQDSLAKKDNASADDFGDLGSPDFIVRCITCHSGGGWMEKDRNGNRYDETDITKVKMFDGDYYSRATNAGNAVIDGHDHSGHNMGGIAAWDWKKSGVVENDCLMCHVSFGALKDFNPVSGVANANALNEFRTLRNTILAKDAQFRSVNTAILEFLNLDLTGDAANDTSLVKFEKMAAVVDPAHAGHGAAPYLLKKDPNDQPLLNWNAAAFDGNKKVAIPMLRFPANDNCMNCHRTSNSRRGFYGFGEGAAAVIAEDGTVVEDYQDDVHKGKAWTEPNGVTRSIETCNACHTRNYYRQDYANVDLDASHDFLKGNSDMDVRNDLDYDPNAKSCEYCHNDAPNPAIPSGQESMLAAHLERWKLSGDMTGYPQSTLTRITQTHLDVVSCQACHITDKKSRGRPLQPMYRYRAAENGDLKIVPYNPRLRYYWKDKNSGRMLTKTERDSVFETRVDDTTGEKYGAIIDPDSGAMLGSVNINHGMHGDSFAEPADYETFAALKKAYDNMFKVKGLANPDTAMVWTESNQYLMSHNTRPAVASVQCEQCHSRKQDGSFSALIAADGLLGESNTKTITQVPDPRLVDEGMVVFDYPYMKADENGKVTENVADILYVSKVDPSMSILRSEVVGVAAGVPKRMSAADAIALAGITDVDLAATLEALFPSGDVFVYKPKYGNSYVREVALMPEANGQTELVFPSYRMQVALSASAVVATIDSAGLGGLASEVFSLKATDSNSNEVTNFSGNRLLVKLPYHGSNVNPDQVKVVFTTDGSSWTAINAADVVTIQPHSDEPGAESKGFVAFWTDHFSDYAVVDSTISVASTTPVAGGASSGGGGGGGAAGYVFLLSLLAGYGLQRRRRFALKS